LLAHFGVNGFRAQLFLELIYFLLVVVDEPLLLVVRRSLGRLAEAGLDRSRPP
jgi:hypothetical protein